MKSRRQPSRVVHGGWRRIHLDAFSTTVFPPLHARKDRTVSLPWEKIITSTSMACTYGGLLYSSDESFKESGSELRDQNTRGSNTPCPKVEGLYFEIENAEQAHPRALVPAALGRLSSCISSGTRWSILSLYSPRVPVESGAWGVPPPIHGQPGSGCTLLLRQWSPTGKESSCATQLTPWLPWFRRCNIGQRF
ncbi:hypothetical protein HAX54_051252 [Datura stramonium]|uniref:Uncharacterized protein n=1 Tax=Datura stramonium TaxID=4076 RepID=A0ABS8WM70_DATST|nr:hypothetical protein [Datura stramonium]